MMNRAQRRATVSTKLLQAQYEEQAKELQQVRNVLFALAKEHGRLRFKQSTVDGLDETDGISAEWDADGVTCVVTYKNHPERRSAS